MTMWDSTLVAYFDRSRIIPPGYRKEVIRVNGNVLPTLLVDGSVAGVWRIVDCGIEVTAFHALPDDVWEMIAAEAWSLLRFLACREVEFYSRFHNWWTKLPDGDRRRFTAD